MIYNVRKGYLKSTCKMLFFGNDYRFVALLLANFFLFHKPFRVLSYSKYFWNMTEVFVKFRDFY